MKASRFSVFARPIATSAVLTACVVTMSFTTASAVDYYWDGSAATFTPATTTPVAPAFYTGSWSNAENLSTTAAPNSTPAAAPTTQVAVFTSTGSIGATAQFINLDGAQSALGLRTVSQTTTTTLLGGTATSTLSLGTSGISHVAGGLVIGSTTAGQEVHISLMGSQTWTSSAAGNGAAALTVNNTISNGSGAAATLTLSGTNISSAINGSITDGTAPLSIIKTGSGIWTFNGTGNTFTGTTSLNAGTLQLTNAGALSNSILTVASGANLVLRSGGSGFSAAQLGSFIPTATFASGSNLNLEVNATLSLSSALTGSFNLIKSGGNDLTLTGTNTYTGTTTITAGRLVIATTANLPSFSSGVVIGAAGTLSINIGDTGFTAGNLSTLLANTTYTSGATLSLNAAVADFSFDGAFSGTGVRLSKTGANTLILEKTSTYTGNTLLAAGTIAVTSLDALGTDGGIFIGSSGTARLRYLGSGDTTTRTFRMDSTTNGVILESSGSGALVINSALTGNSTSGTGTKTLTLTGTNTGGNAFNGAITNYGNTTNLIKNGSGSWTLSGANGYTGTTRIMGGSLTLDYATVDPASSGATTNYIMQSGSVAFKAGALTSDTLTNFQFGETGGTGQFGHAVLKATGGMALTITTLEGSESSQRHNLIDLSGTGNSITVTGLKSSNNLRAATSGLLLNNSSTASSGRANLVLRANDGSYGFAAFAAGTSSGALQKLGGLTTLSPGSVTMGTNTIDYQINAGGTYTAGAQVNFSTLTINTGNTVNAANKVTLALGGNSINASGTGKAILASGANDVTFTGSNGTTMASALWFHNYLESGAAWNINTSMGINGSSTWLVGGTGFTNYSGVGFSGAFILNNGLFRATAAQDLTSVALTAASFRLNSGGVFEIGADLNGAAAGDLTNTIADANRGFRFFGSSGLSAFGALDSTRVANFGGAGAALTWGSSYFLTNSLDNSDSDYALKLSSTEANATIEIQNGINLNGKIRTVEVANGAAKVDGVLSGALTGGVASGLTKTGTGALSLTGANTYGGITRVDSGTLLINGDNSAATGDVFVAAGATLGGSGTIGGDTFISGIHSVGNSPGTQTFASDLTYSSSSTFSWELGSETTSGAGINFDSVVVGGDLTINNAAFRVVVTNLNLDSSFWATNQTWDIFDAGTTTGNFAAFTLYDASNLTNAINYASRGVFSFSSGSGSLQWSAVPEPTNALAGLLIAAGLLRRNRKA